MGWTTALSSLSGLIGLIGVVVGAVVTAWMQHRNARLAREAAERATARDAVRELLATSEITLGLYETVRILDKGGRSAPPQQPFEQAVAAWVDYQHAREKVRVLAPEAFRALVDRLTSALEAETTPVEGLYQRAAGNGWKADESSESAGNGESTEAAAPTPPGAS